MVANIGRSAASRLVTGSTFALVAACLCSGSAQAASANAATTDAAKPRTLGFAVTSIPFALAKNADDCPDGLAMAAKDIYLAAVSPAERTRLQKPENLKEFEQLAYHTKDGKELCEVLDYPREPQRTPKGRVSYGVNLDGTSDGAATANTCGHEKFTSPDGQAGVDNQMYRLIGCSSNIRGFPGEDGYLENLRNASFKDGGTTVLIEVTNVKDGRNDDDVSVGIYNGTSPMVVGANGQMLPYASLTVSKDPKWQSHLHGKIENGILTTTSGDIALYYDFGGYQREYHVKDAHLRLDLNDPKKQTGLLAGYLDLNDVDMTKGTKQLSAEMVGYDCPTFFQAMHRYADGYKDPKTGQCTAMSTAWQVNAIPAFVIHPEDAHKTADATPAH
jgi:hypothetical protein